MKPRGKIVAVLILLLTFAAGGLTGMAAEEAFGLDWFDFFEKSRGGGGDHLLGGLNLSAQQRDRAEAILDRQKDRLEDYWEGRLPEIRKLLDSSYAEIRAILTPDQQAGFDDRIRRLDGNVPAELRDD
jgi:Spy/CpxP family protein refolding chaperone